MDSGQCHEDFNFFKRSRKLQKDRNVFFSHSLKGFCLFVCLFQFFLKTRNNNHVIFLHMEMSDQERTELVTGSD